jgi:type IV pilus assembly protein PilY1
LFDASSTLYDKSGKGFYITFATGEKSVNAPVTIKGTTYFGTNRPLPLSPSSCVSNLGEAKGYALNPFTGEYDSTVYDGGGMPPTPTTGIVTINGKQTEFCIGCGGGGNEAQGGADCKSALGACDNGKHVPKNTRRTYWYKK